MRSIYKNTLLTAVLIGSLFLPGCGCDSHKKGDDAAPAPEASAASGIPVLRSTGKPMANVKLSVFDSEDTISLKPKKGQNLTVVALWSPAWFDGSHDEIEALKALQDKYGADSLRVVCLIYDTPKDKISQLIKEQNIPFEIAQGTPEAYEKLEVHSIPSYWFLDSDGNTLAIYEGLMNLEDFDNNIAGLIRDCKTE
ncbi:redoxin domain-containing protein [bacterium]|nr:redoxin domain-containing protein [bacterium]